MEKLEVIHHVFPDEVEEVFLNRPVIRKVQKGHTKGEDVYKALGQTNASRYLFIIFIYKPEGRTALIVSARDMVQKERRQYER